MIAYFLFYYIAYLLIVALLFTVWFLDRVAIFMRRGRMKKETDISVAVERILCNAKVIEKIIKKEKDVH